MDLVKGEWSIVTAYGADNESVNFGINNPVWLKSEENNDIIERSHSLRSYKVALKLLIDYFHWGDWKGTSYNEVLIIALRLWYMLSDQENEISVEANPTYNKLYLYGIFSGKYSISRETYHSSI